MKKRHYNHAVSSGFALIELMVVIIIVSILAAVAIPIMQGKIDRAKWSEANSAAGTIRSAVSAYVARHSVANAQTALVGESLNNSTVQSALGFTSSDLTTTYFVPDDYTIESINANGHAQIKVTASQSNAPEGDKTLYANGDWL